MKAARRRWKDRSRHWNQRHLLHRLVFFDEAGAKTNMTRRRGRSRRGKHCHDTTPHGHWHTTTMLASVRLDGTTTAMTITGATTGEVFYAYVNNILAPSLRPGDILVLDNLSSHHNKEALACIAQVGARVVFLPPYSPDFNPIEKMWSKVKALLRAAKARTEATLFDAIRCALKAVTPLDATAWFKSCGYSMT